MRVHPKKIGIIPCCGSECAGGCITRIVAARIIYELRASKVETISLPRLLIGTTKEKQFTRLYPTITLDGCAKACAKKALEKYSGKPIVGTIVSDIIGEEVASARVLTSAELAAQHAAEIEKVTGVVTYVIDTLSDMMNKISSKGLSGCGTGCDCGCSSGSDAGGGCGCGCGETHIHEVNHSANKSCEADESGLIIYTKTGCPFCGKAVLEYQEKCVAFREINVSLNPAAKKLCHERYGADKVPIIVQDGVVVQIGDIEGKG